MPMAWLESLSGVASKRSEARTVIRTIMQAVRDHLEERELDYFFLVCTSPRVLRHARRTSIEKKILTIIDELSIPYIETRPRVNAARAAALKGSPALFNRRPPKKSPNSRGQRTLPRIDDGGCEQGILESIGVSETMLVQLNAGSAEVAGSSNFS